MGLPAAKKGDMITAVDMHQTVTPPNAPVLVPHPFNGIIDGELSQDVQIMGLPAATQGSTATNTPSHVPIGGSFVSPPSNSGKIAAGSATVMINGKAAARSTDMAETCCDPKAVPGGKVAAQGTVMIG